MTEAELLRTIDRAVRQQMAQILMGTVAATADQNRTNVRRFQTDSVLENLRNIQPYGVASRPPAGMPCLVIPLAGDATNQCVVGHFDVNRPEVAENEICFYGPAGQMIWFKADGSIYQGSGGNATEPIVLGNILAETIKMIIQAFTSGSPIGVDSLGGPVQIDPGLKSKLQQYLQKYVTDPETNFLSQKNFVERA